jgi:hypothetical protein
MAFTHCQETKEKNKLTAAIEIPQENKFVMQSLQTRARGIKGEAKRGIPTLL